MRLIVLLAPLILAAAPPPDAFHAGTALPDFGRIADVDSNVPVPAGTVFRIAFDSETATEAGKMNRQLDAAARFINLSVAGGVPARDVQLAVVLHGKAVDDVLNAGAYARRHDGAGNANAGLVAALLQHGVKIQVCGQSAAASGVKVADLAEGVAMAPSAMTAHALLQQQGYTLNPF